MRKSEGERSIREEAEVEEMVEEGQWRSGVGVGVVGVLVPVWEGSGVVSAGGGVAGVVSVVEPAASPNLAARLAAALSCFPFVILAKCLQIDSRFPSVRSGNGNEI